jgi:hypothetical protein
MELSEFHHILDKPIYEDESNTDMHSDAKGSKRNKTILEGMSM